MGAEPGRRSLKMPAEKLGPVIVEMKCSRFFLEFFWASLGKFGQKSFATPKICLPLHLWLQLLTVNVIRSEQTQSSSHVT